MIDRIKQLFGLLYDGLDIRKMIIDVSAAQGRIGMETPYDRLAETKVFKFLRRQDRVTKYITVVLVSFIVAFLDQKINPKSFLGQVLEGVLWDSGPELGKRVLDDDGKYLKEYLMQNYDKLSAADREMLPIIWALRGKRLREFIGWYLSSRQNDATAGFLKNLLQEAEGSGFDFSGQTEKSQEFAERIFDSVMATVKTWKHGLDAWLQVNLERGRRKENG